MSQHHDKLRVGIVGLGMGSHHIHAYRKDPNCEIAALCDMNEERLHALAGEQHVPHTFTDPSAMFQSGEVDVVSIATPNTLHAPLSIEAMESGLHVLCEKPMAMNAEQARQMIDVANYHDRKLAIHFNHRMHPEIHTLRSYLEAGDLGEVYFARTFWHRRRGIPARESFLSMEHAGGGAMIDLGVHMLDQTLFLLGYPAVTSVSAQTYTKFHEKDVPAIPMDVDDFALALLRLETGATLEMEISWAGHHDTNEQTLVQLYGTDGGARREWRPGQGTDCHIYRREHGGLVSSRLDQPAPLAHNPQTDLLEAVRQDREPICAGRHGLITMQVLDAIYASSREGREVPVGEAVQASAWK